MTSQIQDIDCSIVLFQLGNIWGDRGLLWIPIKGTLEALTRRNTTINH